MSKTYKFEVRKIVSSYYEVEAKNQEDAFEELEEILDVENLTTDYDDEKADILVGADAKLIGSKKPWRHVNGEQISELSK